MGPTPTFQNTIDAGADAGLLNSITNLTGMYGKVAPAQNRSAGGPGPTAPTNNTSGGGGAAAAAAAVNPLQGQWDAMAGQAQNYVQQLNNIYNGIYGAIDQSAQGQRGYLETQYGDQQNALNQQYGDQARGIQGAMLGRGIAGSSYEGTADDSAANLYKTNLNDIQNNQQNSLAQVGQFADSNKAKYQGLQNLYNNGAANLGTNYNLQGTGLYGISNYVNSLNQAVAQATADRGNFGSNTQFQSDLNKIAPTQNNGVQQLQDQLHSLQTSSIPGSVQGQIAQGIIKNNTQDPASQNYWANYYNNLAGNQAQPA